MRQKAFVDKINNPILKNKDIEVTMTDLQLEALTGLIADICEKLHALKRKETDVTNSTSDVDLVEIDVLLRKIGVEKRDLNRELADLAVQKSPLENNFQPAR